MKGMSAKELVKYHLADESGATKMPFDKLVYVRSSTNSYEVKGINDELLFSQMTASLNVLGF